MKFTQLEADLPLAFIPGGGACDVGVVFVIISRASIVVVL